MRYILLSLLPTFAFHIAIGQVVISGDTYTNLGYTFIANELNNAGLELKNAISLLQNVSDIDEYYLGGIYKTMALISIEKKNTIVANSPNPVHNAYQKCA